MAQLLNVSFRFFRCGVCSHRLSVRRPRRSRPQAGRRCASRHEPPLPPVFGAELTPSAQPRRRAVSLAQRPSARRLRTPPPSRVPAPWSAPWAAPPATAPQQQQQSRAQAMRGVRREDRREVLAARARSLLAQRVPQVHVLRGYAS